MKELLECLQKNPATTAIIIIALVVFVYMLYKKKENMTGSENTTSLSNEAVQNIASVYAETSGTVNFNNLNAQNFKGIIVAWSGTVANIPTGWALCDGTNGTPNLGNRFIYGAVAGSTRSIGDTGGDENHTLTQNEMPQHIHNVSLGPPGVGVNIAASPGGVLSSTIPAGGGASHNNMPPYYVLAYIMKL
jgi:microcystin-dependent protein